MTEKLQKLISLAITDGVITDKERDILLKNAIEEGVDLDEFEMELDARLFERQQELKAETASQIIPPPAPEKPKSNKEGDIKKCPSCGASVVSFVLNCSDCGHEFRNVESNASIQKLFKMLDDVEEGRKDDEGMSVGKAIGGMFAKAYGFGGVGDKVNNRKKEIIKNFPIPTTKDDILEFLALAIPNARKQGNFFTSGAFNSPVNERNKLHNEFIPVWKSKCEQIIIKARFLMKDDPKTLQEIEHYAKEVKIK